MNTHIKSILCVKSITTIIITIALCVFTFMYPDMLMDTFKSVVTMIVTFYFAHQKEKNGGKNGV